MIILSKSYFCFPRVFFVLLRKDEWVLKLAPTYIYAISAPYSHKWLTVEVLYMYIVLQESSIHPAFCAPLIDSWLFVHKTFNRGNIYIHYIFTDMFSDVSVCHTFVLHSYFLLTSLRHHFTAHTEYIEKLLVQSRTVWGGGICAADFALLNLPKGKSLGRSKLATSSYAQAPQHTVWDDSYYIQALLNCLL